MRDDVYFPRYPSADIHRQVEVLHYKAADTTWVALINGTATPYQNLSEFVSRAMHQTAGFDLELRFHTQLYGVAQPRVGDLVQVRLDGEVLFSGQVDGLNGYREANGERTFGLTVRTRDTTPLWRSTKWMTEIYPAGTELGIVVQDILKAIGLQSNEYQGLIQTGLHTVHGDSQLADLPVWDMLSMILLVAGLEPYIGANGVLKTVSRDVMRPHSLVLEKDQVLNITGDRQRTPVTNLLLKWLDPALSRSNGQSQVLGKESITAGFFKLKQERKVYWSEDRRQRAENTFMKTLASVNDGLLPVGVEEYEEIDEFHGKITVTTMAWVPTLATATLAAMLISAKIPDGVAITATIPLGRVIEMAGQVAYFLIIMSLGTGAYEIWGEPYDLVHEVNTTEAYDQNAPAWVRLEETVSNDFVMNEEHAQTVAVRELLYRSLSAHSWNVEIVDNPLIERGDILKLPDGSRLYVTEFTRDVSHGAPAILSLQGFRV